MADDLGREAVGCYGGTSYKTPVIDQLAQTGVRFDSYTNGSASGLFVVCLKFLRTLLVREFSTPTCVRTLDFELAVEVLLVHSFLTGKLPTMTRK